MKIRLLVLLLLAAVALPAQETEENNPFPVPKPRPPYYEIPDPVPFANTITSEAVQELLEVLASAEMSGRETGEDGQRKAAEYIAGYFKNLGLPPVSERKNYMQDMQLQNESWKDIGIKVDEQEFKNRTDFYVFPSYNPDRSLTQLKEVVFVGYGIEDEKYNDYQKANVEGKAVLFYDGEPLDNNGNSLITGTEFRSQWSLDWQKKVKLAKAKGATMVFIVDTDFAENSKKNRKNTSTYGWKPFSTRSQTKDEDFVSNIFISPALAGAILGKKAEKADDAMTALKENNGKFKPVKVKSKIDVRLDKEVKRLDGSNVIGFIEGTDPYLKNEYVFITAHYDHLGKVEDVIYHGADDNGSGTAGVMTIAKAFQDAKLKGIGPKRSVVCMLVSGEEKGLLGSKFYVDNPLFSLAHTVVDINIDMIGRIDEKHAGNGNYIYVIGSDRISTDLHRINEKVNKQYTQLELDYRYNAKDDPNNYYERSDHYNFAEKGIPAIFYFNGTHADYHRPTDTSEKIDYQALAKRAQLAFHTAWEIANMPVRISADVKQ